MKRFSTLIFAGMFVIGAACSSSTTNNGNVANTNTVMENTNSGELNTNTSVEVNTNTSATVTDTNSTPITFGAAKKSAHYVSNLPVHASTLTTPPATVSIDFNFDLSEQSTIEIIKDGRDYGMGVRSVTNSKRTLEQAFDATAPDGLYTVQYNACWPDGSCHTGNFQFVLKRPA